MDILALGWVSILVLFAWSLAMVVWGRNGFSTVETTLSSICFVWSS